MCVLCVPYLLCIDCCHMCAPLQVQLLLIYSFISNGLRACLSRCGVIVYTTHNFRFENFRFILHIFISYYAFILILHIFN